MRVEKPVHLYWVTVPDDPSEDGEIFRAYVEQVLCPKLQPRDVVILDNLSATRLPASMSQ